MRPDIRAAITIDVDSLRFYRAIHGLDATGADEESDPIYTVAMPRFWELLTEIGAPSTLFLIGEDAPRYRSAFLRAAETGSEIANHSFGHDYRLTAHTPEAITADLARAHDALLPLSPSGRITGFRAPGYNTSKPMLTAVSELSYAYDSSLLPSPMYFAARAAAIGAYAIMGRSSRSIRGNVHAFAGPLAPYPAELARPWRAAAGPSRGRRGGMLLEIPITCEPVTRAPLIGTTWVLAGERIRRTMLKSALERLLVINFEMHAIDLLDGSDPGVMPDLARAQRDLRVPVSRKMSAFRDLFATLSDHAAITTLAAIAAKYGPDT